MRHLEVAMEEAVSAGVPRRRPAVAPVFRGRYLSITSYKRDGTSIATPVWFVQQDGRLLVETDGASGKVKRIRRHPAVLVAVCSATGRLRGPQVPATAEILARFRGQRHPAADQAQVPGRHGDLQAAPVRPGQAAPRTARDQAGDPGDHPRLTATW